MAHIGTTTGLQDPSVHSLQTTSQDAGVLAQALSLVKDSRCRVSGLGFQPAPSARWYKSNVWGLGPEI